MTVTRQKQHDQCEEQYDCDREKVTKFYLISTFPLIQSKRFCFETKNDTLNHFNSRKKTL